MMSKRFYFAYGSNMSEAQMASRCPDSRIVGTGRLNNHRFIINERGVASITECDGRVVYGLAWDISKSDEHNLDGFEGVARGLYRKAIVPIVLQGDRSADALVYVAASSEQGSPRAGYMEGIVKAAKSLNFPVDVVEELESWLATSAE